MKWSWDPWSNKRREKGEDFNIKTERREVKGKMGKKTASNEGVASPTITHNTTTSHFSFPF